MEEELVEIPKLLKWTPKALRQQLGRASAQAYAEGYSAGWAEAFSAALQRSLIPGQLGVSVANTIVQPEDLDDIVLRLADPVRVDDLFVAFGEIPKTVEQTVVRFVLPALRNEGRLAGRADLLLELLTRQLGPTSLRREYAVYASEVHRDALLEIALNTSRELPTYACSLNTLAD